MDGLLRWVTNITYYLIFISVISALLPDKKYEKYMKLFAGLVLILLVLQPLTSGLRIEDRIARYFETITFQNQVQELSKDAGEIEALRLNKMLESYERAIEGDIKLMAEGHELTVTQIQVNLQGDQTQENFTAVQNIFMTVTKEKEEKKGEIAVEVKIEEIKPVTKDNENQREEKKQSDLSVNRLRKQIGEYYNLEEEKIEIFWEGE